MWDVIFYKKRSYCDWKEVHRYQDVKISVLKVKKGRGITDSGSNYHINIWGEGRKAIENYHPKYGELIKKADFYQIRSDHLDEIMEMTQDIKDVLITKLSK